MKGWIVRALVPLALAGGGIAVAAAPAQAGTWVSGGWYQYLSKCREAGNYRVSNGTYETYVCNKDGPGYWLRGFVN